MKCYAPNHDAFEALNEYLFLRDELRELESRESECTCDAYNFHTCSLCEMAKEKINRSDFLITAWGDNWAVSLGAARAHKCQLPCGIQEALNSGDGVYRP